MPQLETFKAADEAINGMLSRHGNDCDWTLERLAELGFRLALVRVTVEAVMVLQSPND